MYASDVIREMDGQFDGYIQRMEDASGEIGRLCDKLKFQVANSQWGEFAEDMLRLNAMLYGIGARDCAARARKLSQAGKEQNTSYIHEDFYSLMGNMYMLEKKIGAIVPAVQNEGQPVFINSPEFLYGCLKQVGKAIEERDQAEALVRLDHAISLSLDKELDVMLEMVQKDLKLGDLHGARVHHEEMLRQYAGRIVIKDSEQI